MWALALAAMVAVAFPSILVHHQQRHADGRRDGLRLRLRRLGVLGGIGKHFGIRDFSKSSERPSTEDLD